MNYSRSTCQSAILISLSLGLMSGSVHSNDVHVTMQDGAEILSFFSPGELQGLCNLIDEWESIRPGFSQEGIKCGHCGYEIGWGYLIGYLANPKTTQLRTELFVLFYGKSGDAIKEYSLQVANSLPIPCIKCWNHAWI